MSQTVLMHAEPVTPSQRNAEWCGLRDNIRELLEEWGTTSPILMTQAIILMMDRLGPPEIIRHDPPVERQI